MSDARAEGLEADRVPPQDLDAEQATLGAMLLGGEATAKVAEILGPHDFYRDAHAAICAACLALSERHEPIDIVSVAAQLKAQGQFDNLGGFDYLDRLIRAMPYSTNVERYANLVKEKSLLRQLLFLSQNIARSCYDPAQTAGEALDRAESEVLKLAQNRSLVDFEPVSTIAYRVFEEAEQRMERGADIAGVSTGYVDVDRILSGLQGGELVILAARPSMGKTSLAVCFALNASLRGARTPVAMFSLEMSKEQIVGGMLCTEAQVNLSRWRSGKLENDDWSSISVALNELVQAKLFIDDTPALSPFELRARARRIKAQHGLGVIVVDYLQLMRGSERTENRVQEISGITRSLKGLAKELDVSVIALSQLSRAVESRNDKRPMLSDLRESGQIEADADVVMFLYRDAYYKQKEQAEASEQRVGLDDNAKPDETEVIVAKQRSGPTGIVKLGFQRQFKRFVNFDSNPAGY